MSKNFAEFTNSIIMGKDDSFFIKECSLTEEELKVLQYVAINDMKNIIDLDFLKSSKDGSISWSLVLKYLKSASLKLYFKVYNDNVIVEGN